MDIKLGKFGDSFENGLAYWNFFRTVMYSQSYDNLSKLIALTLAGYDTVQELSLSAIFNDNYVVAQAIID